MIIKVYPRVYPSKADITIKNEIKENLMVGGGMIPTRVSKITRIEFGAPITKTDYADHPRVREGIEIIIGDDIHKVIVEDARIEYDVSGHPLSILKGSGIITESYKDTDHQLKRAVKRATREKV